MSAPERTHTDAPLIPHYADRAGRLERPSYLLARFCAMYTILDSVVCPTPNAPMINHVKTRRDGEAAVGYATMSIWCSRGYFPVAAEPIGDDGALWPALYAFGAASAVIGRRERQDLEWEMRLRPLDALVVTARSTGRTALRRTTAMARLCGWPCIHSV